MLTFVKRPFFAKYDQEAIWQTDLKAALNEAYLEEIASKQASPLHCHCMLNSYDR